MLKCSVLTHGKCCWAQSPRTCSTHCATFRVILCYCCCCSSCCSNTSGWHCCCWRLARQSDIMQEDCGTYKWQIQRQSCECESYLKMRLIGADVLICAQLHIQLHACMYVLRMRRVPQQAIQIYERHCCHTQTRTHTHTYTQISRLLPAIRTELQNCRRLLQINEHTDSICMQQ